MFSLSRFLLCLFLGSLILAPTLTADEAPPLPPPTANNAVLKGLGAMISGNSTAEQKTTLSEPFPSAPSRPIPSAHQEQSVPNQLPIPHQVSQASFTTIPLAKLPQEAMIHAEQTAETALSPEEPVALDSPSPSEPIDSPNETLDKPLFSRKSANSEESAESEDTPKIGSWKNKLAKPELTPMISVGGSLLIVVAAFFLLAIVLRKVTPKGSRPLPQEAFECLGRYYLTQKHQVQLLRVGSRIVFVSVMPDGVKTLSEITDPDEAVALLGLCRRLDSHSATEMFRKTVASISEEEINRSHQRPVVTRQHSRQSSASLDLYSDPDESLAAILARGRQFRE